MHAILSAFATADPFGKAIFIALFALSILCWSLLIYKVWLIREVEKMRGSAFHLARNVTDAVLTIAPTAFRTSKRRDVPAPFRTIYETLQLKTKELLDKNHYFEQRYLTQPDIELIDAHVGATIASSRSSVERHFFLLSMTATLAPFLGLLGTVWGILLTFSGLQSGASFSSNAAILGGLSTALTTTVLGLVIAIPALISYSYLQNASKRLSEEMDQFRHILLSTVELQYRRPDGK